jgi:ATP-dependent DNA helicase RecG
MRLELVEHSKSTQSASVMGGAMNLPDIKKMVARGESETVELKASSGQLNRAGETLCAFLNGDGGTVLMGVAPNGKIVGQEVSDKTERDIASVLRRFEPPAPIKVGFVAVPRSDRKVIVLDAPPPADARPFTFDGRPYERIRTTTSVMAQERYESLLLERAHARRRWENQPAVDVRLEHLDREEILRTRDAAIQQRRISAGTSTDIGDILDRLGLRREGVITQAAQMLYGTRFLPDYPQGLLKMGRFRGTKITGDILDNKQEHMHAFAMVREGMAFLDRTLPLGARFPEGKIFREDRLPVPPNALREILLNAVMHRDYSESGSYVAIAVFDDRIEIWSIGRLLAGVTIEALSGPHRSKLRNPLIADAFHRTGAVEIWGRGTNRVIDECKQYGIDPPSFAEVTGALVVTFRAAIGPSATERHQVRHQVGTKSGPSRPGTKLGPSRDQVGTKLQPTDEQVRVLAAAREPQPIPVLMQACDRSNRTKFRNQVLQPLLDAGLLAMTVPDKPRSSKQKYRTTVAGWRFLAT